MNILSTVVCANSRDVGAFVTPEGSASFSRPINSADFDLQALGLPVGVETEVVRAVASEFTQGFVSKSARFSAKQTTIAARDGH